MAAFEIRLKRNSRFKLVSLDYWKARQDDSRVFRQLAKHRLGTVGNVGDGVKAHVIPLLAPQLEQFDGWLRACAIHPASLLGLRHVQV